MTTCLLPTTPITSLDEYLATGVGGVGAPERVVVGGGAVREVEELGHRPRVSRRVRRTPRAARQSSVGSARKDRSFL